MIMKAIKHKTNGFMEIIGRIEGNPITLLDKRRMRLKLYCKFPTLDFLKITSKEEEITESKT